MNTQPAERAQDIERVFLIGPSGSGKSTVAARVASLLAWDCADSDTEVAQRTGTSIAELFAAAGEPRFRDAEADALATLCARRHVVIATGGGIGDRPENLARMRARGWIVALAVRPETALNRIVTQSGDTEPAALRPMLAGDDPLARMRALYARRADWYRAADETIVADDLAADEVAARIVAGLVARGALPAGGVSDHVRHVGSGAGTGYDAVVAWGGLASLPERLRVLGLPPRLHVVADAQVAKLYEPALMAALLRAGFEPLVFRVPACACGRDKQVAPAARRHPRLAGRAPRRAR